MNKIKMHENPPGTILGIVPDSAQLGAGEGLSQAGERSYSSFCLRQH